MIGTQTTKLEPLRPDDGSLLDLDPRRRRARLARGGVTVDRQRLFTHVVHFPDGSVRRYRTPGNAQMAAHAYLDAT